MPTHQADISFQPIGTQYIIICYHTKSDQRALREAKRFHEYRFYITNNITVISSEIYTLLLQYNYIYIIILS